ncbi:MAG TPA: hypothetical protein VGM26_03105 [Rhizomicrobium sp.]|jgi:hypothetical protein
MSHAAALQEKGAAADRADLATLRLLALAPLPFEHRALRKMRMIKNMRLEAVIELFGGNAGSGQATVKSIAKGLELGSSNDLSLLRLLEALPSFDEYSLRINLRNSSFSIPGEFERAEPQTGLLNSSMSEFMRPLAEQLERLDPVSNYDEMLKQLRECVATQGALQTFAARLDSDGDSVIAFLEDYADTTLSLGFYRKCLDQMMPSIEDLLHSVRDLRAGCRARGDGLLLGTLDMVEGTVNQMIADVTGRIESFEISTQGVWIAMTPEQFAKIPGKCRDYQASTAGVLCALAVKMAGWIQNFPVQGSGAPVRRASFIMSEMRQGMEHIRGLLGAAPILAEDRAS